MYKVTEFHCDILITCVVWESFPEEIQSTHLLIPVRESQEIEVEYTQVQLVEPVSLLNFHTGLWLGGELLIEPGIFEKQLHYWKAQPTPGEDSQKLHSGCSVPLAGCSRGLRISSWQLCWPVSHLQLLFVASLNLGRVLMNFASSLDTRHLFTLWVWWVLYSWRQWLNGRGYHTKPSNYVHLLFCFSPSSSSFQCPLLWSYMFFFLISVPNMRGKEMWFLCSESGLFYLTHQSLFPDLLARPDKRFPWIKPNSH